MKQNKTNFQAFILLIGIFIAGCRKEETKAPTVAKLSFVGQAMKVLKYDATPDEFNNLNWANVQSTTLSDNSQLLRISSKTDTNKILLYSKRNKVIRVRWVQLNNSLGTVAVSSVNENREVISSFKNGRIYATTRFDKSTITKTQITGNPLVRTSEEEPPPEQPIDDGSGDSGVTINDGGGGGSGGDGGGDGGSSGGTNADGSTGNMTDGFTLQEVVITGSQTSEETFYSLYSLLGNASGYENEYTNNPGAPSKGTIIKPLPSGNASGIDKSFYHGRTFGTPIITFQPYAMFAGISASFGYNITTVNGVPSISVSNISAGLVGNTVIQSWTTLATASSISGSTINFSISGTSNVVVGAGSANLGTIFQTPMTVTGTYDTNTGAYTIYVQINDNQ